MAGYLDVFHKANAGQPKQEEDELSEDLESDLEDEEATDLRPAMAHKERAKAEEAAAMQLRERDQEGKTIAPTRQDMWNILSYWIGSKNCLLYTSPSPRDRTRSRMPSSA